MPRRVLDTCTLINHWRTKRRLWDRRPLTPRVAVKWARDLVRIQHTNAIVSPVYIEFVCGGTTKQEVELSRSFLDEFDIVDEGRILPEDWTEARRIAERVPRNARPRQLGDCLIRAICNRLHLDVLTDDTGFPQSH